MVNLGETHPSVFDCFSRMTAEMTGYDTNHGLLDLVFPVVILIASNLCPLDDSQIMCQRFFVLFLFFCEKKRKTNRYNYFEQMATSSSHWTVGHRS